MSNNSEQNFLARNSNSPIPYPDSYPKNIVSGKRACVYGSDGKQYIDMWMGYGALLFGHSDQQIVDLLHSVIEKGWFFSYQTLIEKQVAELIHNSIPSAERIRFATTGSDAVAYAIRASRSYTGRSNVLTIDGGYHGVHENMISSTGSLSSQTPDLVKFNDIQDLGRAFSEKKYACFILEPILANNGCVPAQKEYLEQARVLCDKYETILIFDEIVTGFRIGSTGAQGYYNVTPDITLFSKAIASGFPLSVVCGKETILNEFNTKNGVFFAGTFNGLPVSLHVAEHILNRVKDSKELNDASDFASELRKYIGQEIERLTMSAVVSGVGSMLSLSFGIQSLNHGLKHENFNSEAYDQFVGYLADEHNVLFPPLPTETIFISAVHIEYAEEIKKAITKGLEYLNKKF